MKLFLITLLVFGLFLLAMSVGVILGNRRIKGSCGGLGNCEACREGDEDTGEECLTAVESAPGEIEMLTHSSTK